MAALRGDDVRNFFVPSSGTTVPVRGPRLLLGTRLHQWPGAGPGDVPVIGRPRTDVLMTVPEVLEELNGVSRRTFYRWRELGVGPRAFKLPNGELRIRRSAFTAWLSEREDEAA